MPGVAEMTPSHVNRRRNGREKQGYEEPGNGVPSDPAE
jgi:hypothetical protein